MERLQSKIEGKGNGIKTVVANLQSVAQSLARPPAYLLKYFGFELGAQTQIINDERFIVNGSHDAAKLQDQLDGFINKFVLCRSCSNPETEINVKQGRIFLDCKACGQQSEVDPRLKLSSYVLKNEGSKGKKDKSRKKADRKARKEAKETQNGDHASQNGNGTPHDSNSDHQDENGEVELEAGSDDEFTKKIQNDAKDIEETEPTEIQWSVDTSEAAVKARANNLAGDLKHNLLIDDDDEGDDAGNVFNDMGAWVIKTAEEKGGVNKLENADIFLHAKELGIEKKHKTLNVLAQTIFDDGIVKEIPSRAVMLKKMITSERHEKAFLGGIERFVGKEKPNLIPQVSAILLNCYQNDLVSEDVAKAWGSKASKKYVDLPTSKKVRKSAEKFLQWLEEAEEEDSDENDDE